MEGSALSLESMDWLESTNPRRHKYVCGPLLTKGVYFGGAGGRAGLAGKSTSPSFSQHTKWNS